MQSKTAVLRQVGGATSGRQPEVMRGTEGAGKVHSQEWWGNEGALLDSAGSGAGDGWCGLSGNLNKQS